MAKSNPKRYHKLCASQKARLTENGVTEKAYDKYRSRQMASNRQTRLEEQDLELISFDNEIKKLMQTTPKLNKGGSIKAYMMSGGMANKRNHMYPGGGYVSDKLKGK